MYFEIIVIYRDCIIIITHFYPFLIVHISGELQMILFFPHVYNLIIGSDVVGWVIFSIVDGVLRHGKLAQGRGSTFMI